MLSPQDKLRAQWDATDEEEIDAAVNAMLQQRQTKRFLWWLLRIGHWGEQPYAKNALDTAFNCGELNVGQKIAARVLEVDPLGFVNMQKEMEDERRNREQQLAGANEPDSFSEPDPGAEPERYE